MRGLGSQESPEAPGMTPPAPLRRSSPAGGPPVPKREHSGGTSTLLRCGAMDLPASVKALTAIRVGVGVSALTAPSALAIVFGRPRAEATTPMATLASSLFGVRELGLAAITARATADEPRGLRRILLIGAATDGLDLVVMGLWAVRDPRLRRTVFLFAPASLLSVALHLRAAQKVEVTP